MGAYGNPALVLNADFQPLSYYPLSLWSWQDAIKAVFLERVTIIENYDKEVHSPSLIIKLPSVIALRNYVALHSEAQPLQDLMFFFVIILHVSIVIKSY